MDECDAGMPTLSAAINEVKQEKELADCLGDWVMLGEYVCSAYGL